MSILDRLYPWPHGLLPRRSAAARNSPHPAAPAALVANGPVAAPVAESERRALTERRSQALRTMFPMLFSMVARRSDLWQAIAIERYLSQAPNLADLEQRIQEVQRRRNSSWSE
jgi:hypothetical protein